MTPGRHRILSSSVETVRRRVEGTGMVKERKGWTGVGPP